MGGGGRTGGVRLHVCVHRQHRAVVRVEPDVNPSRTIALSWILHGSTARHFSLLMSLCSVLLLFFSPLHTGSHNAITYCLDMNNRSPIDLKQPDMLQKLDKYMKPLIRPFVYKWAVTQVTITLKIRASLKLLFITAAVIIKTHLWLIPGHAFTICSYNDHVHPVRTLSAVCLYSVALRKSNYLYFCRRRVQVWVWFLFILMSSRGAFPLHCCLIIFSLDTSTMEKHPLGPHIEVFPVEQPRHANSTLAINTRSPSFVI